MSGKAFGTPKKEETPESEAGRVVLIAEDEEPIAQALAYLVEDAGYTAVVAANGRAAFELALARRPALIITDLMMPQMSGQELIRALRETWKGELGQSAAPPIVPPIVLMTAAGRRYAEDAGADALLLKPFELEQVEALLRRFLAIP